MTDELAGLLAAGERAAFHGRPASGVAPLERAVEAARSSGRDDEAVAATWLLGVSLAAAGRYGHALTVLQPLGAPSEAAPAAGRLFASLGASTEASVHRQLGRHEAARGLDEAALDRAAGAAEAEFDARLGLAADAVGLGAADAARRDLAEATGLAEGRADWWRQRVRLGWVRAEVALLGGDAAEAARAADASVTLAESSGAPRHVAKGLLFQGVAQLQAGDDAEAVASLRRSATLAESLGCLPLLWPSRALLGALLEQEVADEAARHLASARSAVLAIAEDLPELLRAEWLARPDVAALLGG